MGYLDDILAAGRIYNDPDQLASRLKRATTPQPDYKAQLDATADGPLYDNRTQALTAQAKQAQQAYQLPVAEPEAVPAGSITADRASNPVDRYITDSDAVRRLGPEGRRLVTGVTDFATSPFRAAYDAPGAFQRGDYLSGALDTAEALPAVGKAAAAVKGSAALAGTVAKGVGLTQAAFVPVSFAEKMKFKGMRARGASLDDIWHDTQTGPLPEGKLIKEIDDRGLRVGVQAVAGTSGNQLVPHPLGGGWQGDIQHPELFQREPWLTNTDLRIVAGPPNEGGAYYPGTSPPFIDINANAHPSMGGPEGIAAHEVPHAIQNRYGWSPGGNPGILSGQPAADYAQYLINQGIKNGALPPGSTPASVGMTPARMAYQGSSGEDMANVQSARLTYDMQQRANEPPWDSSELARSGIPRLLYEGQRMPLRPSKFNDELNQLYNIYGYGGTP